MITTNGFRPGDVLFGTGVVMEVLQRADWQRLTVDTGQGRRITFDIPTSLLLVVERQDPASEVRPRRAASSITTKSKFQQASPTPPPATTPPASAANASDSATSSGIGVPAVPSPTTRAHERPGNS